MDLGLPNLSSKPLTGTGDGGIQPPPSLEKSATPPPLPRLSAMYVKPLWERTAFVSWTMAVGGILTRWLSDDITGKELGKAVAIATISAVIALLTTKDSVGVNAT